MPPLHLTQTELEEITGRKRRSAQARVLRKMGIEFRMNPDGKILVVREHYVSGGSLGKNLPVEPDFDSIRG